MDGGFLFLILIVVIGGIVFSVHQSKQANVAWASAARSLGLFHDAGSLVKSRKITGRVEGCRVTVDTFTRGSGKSSRKYTRYHVSFPQALGFGMSISRQGFMSGVAKAFGAQDIEVGDRGFDDLVTLKGDNPAAVLNFLTDERRAWIRNLMVEFKSLKIDEAGITMESSGMESSAHVLIRKVRRMMEATKALTNFEAPQADAVPRSKKPPPIPVSAAKPKVEWVPPAAPEPIKRTVAELSPPSLPVVEEVQEQRPTSPVPVVPSAPEEEPARAEPSLDVAGVGAKLFDGNRGIGDINREFAAEYLDQLATGSGVLRQWKRSSFDFAFGSGSYTLATLEFLSDAETAGGHDSFQVTLKLPDGTPEPEAGKPLAFRGRLLKVDGLMRRIFIKDADLG